MKTAKATFVALTLAIMITGAHASATTNPNTSTSKQTVPADDNRMNRRFGAYVGILGDPHPTNFGFNVAYNLADFLRASVGFGKISAPSVSVSSDGSNVSIGDSDSSMTTIGAALKYLVPGWNLSPTATLGYSHVSISGDMVAIDYKSSNIYLGIGGDWQAASGFNLGAGMNLSLNSGAPTAPYINVGMFF